MLARLHFNVKKGGGTDWPIAKSHEICAKNLTKIILFWIHFLEGAIKEFRSFEPNFFVDLSYMKLNFVKIL